MLKLLRCFFCFLLVTGCSTHNSQTFTQFHEDGMAKPVVVVNPVIDSTSYDVSWSLSEEFTSLIVHSLAQTGKIFIPAEIKQQSHFTHNPFGPDLDWVKKHYNNSEFIVFLELIEHDDIPVSKKYKKSDSSDTSHDIKMAMRVRVLDLRNEAPKVILQEVIHYSYYVPKTILHTDYNYAIWGSEEYISSPMNIAHQQLVKQITSRLSDYIMLAKSR